MTEELDFQLGAIENEPDVYLGELSALLTDVRGALCGADDYKVFFVDPGTRIRLVRCQTRTLESRWFEMWGFKPARDILFTPAAPGLGISTRADIYARQFQLIKHFHCCEDCTGGTAEIFICLPRSLARLFKAVFNAEPGELRYILTQVFLQQTIMALLERSAPTRAKIPAPVAKPGEAAGYSTGPGAGRDVQ